MTRCAALIFSLGLALALACGTASMAQSLLNGFHTVAMQRCLAAVETKSAPRTRTLFTGNPESGLLPEEIFAAVAYWTTNDGRIYVAADARGNCAVGDTMAAEDARAHERAIRRFDAWAVEEIDAGRYIDANLAEETLAYRRTFVSTGWSGSPILVTLVSDQSKGLLAMVAERSEVVVDAPSGEMPTETSGEGAALPETAEPEAPSSNLLEGVPQGEIEINSDNSL